MEQPAGKPWWRTPYWIAFWGFVAIAGFFLVTEHAAHLFGALPFLLLAACPLMHLFGHRGHGHGDHGDGGARSDGGASGTHQH